MKFQALFFLFFLFVLTQTFAQKATSFTRADSLRGGLPHERTCFDVRFYDLQIEVKPEKKAIQGVVNIYFSVKANTNRIQLDLFENLKIEKILFRNKKMAFKREFDAFFVDFPETLNVDDTASVAIFYSGKPREAVNPPWDGGFSWKKDKKGRDWIGISCEGLGASVWWANKDHLSDEPDSMRIFCTVPENLMCVANGNLRKEIKGKNKTRSFEWFVSYPINNYNVTLNIANYEHFSEKYVSKEFGELALDYYVLDYNIENAKKHFQQVKPMLACYEKYFGKYPFWNDGFALVETSYWGMEHQGAIAYGNNYVNLPIYDFDYIIIHESGHEYFGNSISAKDHADMWIHEAFTTYAEAIFVEEKFDYATAVQYLNGQKMNIINQVPIQGIKNVNFKDWGDADMYYKGAWILHTLRSVVQDDALWFATIKSFCVDFYHKQTDSDEVIAYFSKKLNRDLTGFFAQYLTQAKPPVFAFSYEKAANGDVFLVYAWEKCMPDFVMPVELLDKNGKTLRLEVSTKMQKIKIEATARYSLDKKKFYCFDLQR